MGISAAAPSVKLRELAFCYLCFSLSCLFKCKLFKESYTKNLDRALW